MPLMLKNYPSNSCLKAFPISAKIKKVDEGNYEIYVAEHLAEKWRSDWESFKLDFIFKIAKMAFIEAVSSSVSVDIYFGDEDTHLYLEREVYG